MPQSVITNINLNLTRKDSAYRVQAASLSLETRTYCGKGAVSTASVHWLGDDGTIDFGHGQVEQFHQTIYDDSRAPQTQEAFERQHAMVFTPERLADLKTTITAHYKAISSEKHTYYVVA